jgi:Nucleotidyltransferase substrate binding protein like
VFRMSAKAGLIDDVDIWLKFRDARNKTSHTYDGDIAQAVVEMSHVFLPVAKTALKSMETKND